MSERDNRGYFVTGNKAAEKWTEKSVIKLLESMWQTVATSEESDQLPTNPVRANDIKTIAEICLIHDVCPDTWTYFGRKFSESPAVLRLIKKIKWVIESRMIYSGQTMDIFVLKQHYDYTDKKELDLTTNGKSLPASEPATIIVNHYHTGFDILEGENETDDE